MKADIDKDGYLKIDAQTLVQAMPDKVLRDIAKYALFDELVLAGIIGALVNNTMWDDDAEPWWFSSETFTKLRLQLLPLLPDIMAEAVRCIEREARQAKTEKTRWNDAAWKLWHAWTDHSTRPEMERWPYEHQTAMTRDQAKAHLEATEKRIAAERSELEQLRSQLDAARIAARALIAQVDNLGAFADDNDPRVMAVAGPLSEAQASLWLALGLSLDDERARLVADIDSRCAVCGWTLGESSDKGCVRGNCSHRPRPEKLYAPARAERELAELRARQAEFVEVSRG